MCFNSDVLSLQLSEHCIDRTCMELEALGADTHTLISFHTACHCESYTFDTKLVLYTIYVNPALRLVQRYTNPVHPLYPSTHVRLIHMPLNPMQSFGKHHMVLLNHVQDTIMA